MIRRLSLLVLAGLMLCAACSSVSLAATQVGEGGRHAVPDERSIATQVRKIVAEQLGADERTLTNSASFVADMGADELDLVELVMALEDAFDLEIPDEAAKDLTTVQAAIDYVVTHKG